MRVLWFTNNPCKYISSGGYHGGGWMSSLQEVILTNSFEIIDLGVSFCMDGQPEKVVQEGVSYYPVPQHVKPLKDKVIDILYHKDVRRDEILWQHYISHFKKVIDDFQPDVVEVFGSELYTGLGTVAAKELKVPCVLHLQGILSLCIYTLLPTGVSRQSFIMKDGIKGGDSNFQLLTYWKRSCHREKAILNAVNHVIGRTEWDKHALEILNPQAQYHWGGEILRLDFEWNVYGNVQPTFFEKLTGVNHKDVNVNLKGVASAEQLREAMLQSTLYFQPSYVENSPNSVAEAQMLGLPVVATNVGGTSSMVKHSETGFLFPATDPYMAAYYVKCLIQNNSQNVTMGENGKKTAMQRHDRDVIVKGLIETYKKVIADDR